MPFDPMQGDPGAPLSKRGASYFFDHGDRLLEKIAERSHIASRLLHHYPIESRGLVLLFCGVVLSILLPPAVLGLLRLMRLTDRNFRGDVVVRGYGLLILLWTGIMMGLAAVAYPFHTATYVLWLWGTMGFGVLGFIDDCIGDRTIKGLNHFRVLLHGKFTTGQMKALGGTIVSVYVGHRIAGPTWPDSLLAAATIALAANAINLFDVRPGRAGAVFIVASCGLIYASHRAVPNTMSPLIFVLIPTLITWQRDSAGKAMLGDTGSNLLGSALGIAAVYLGRTACIITLTFSLLLHLAAAKRSFTEAIESNPVFRRIDALTGVRGPHKTPSGG
jgi:UDP-N-acetylmuramyl pentapeptide phosphotransferase/UDP-N-acetylglucosamine-1-phosphate transferase